MQKVIFLILSLLLLIPLTLNAQRAGRIYFRDSTIQEVKEFTKLRTELHYYRKSNASGTKQNSSIDLIREYSVQKIQGIRFRYEKGKGSEQFYYQLVIEGELSDGSKLKRKIKTWDWLEMIIPASGATKNTEIIFFTENKKLDIVKIEFD